MRRLTWCGPESVSPRVDVVVSERVLPFAPALLTRASFHRTPASTSRVDCCAPAIDDVIAFGYGGGGGVSLPCGGGILKVAL